MVRKPMVPGLALTLVTTSLMLIRETHSAAARMGGENTAAPPDEEVDCQRHVIMIAAAIRKKVDVVSGEIEGLRARNVSVAEALPGDAQPLQFSRMLGLLTPARAASKQEGQA